MHARAMTKTVASRKPIVLVSWTTVWPKHPRRPRRLEPVQLKRIANLPARTSWKSDNVWHCFRLLRLLCRRPSPRQNFIFRSLCLPASCNEVCPLLTACRAALKSDKLGATARCKPLCSADFSWSLKPAGRAADALTTLKFDQMDSRLPFAKHDAQPSPESRSSSQENFDCHCL